MNAFISDVSVSSIPYQNQSEDSTWFIFELIRLAECDEDLERGRISQNYIFYWFFDGQKVYHEGKIDICFLLCKQWFQYMWEFKNWFRMSDTDSIVISWDTLKYDHH